MAKHRKVGTKEVPKRQAVNSIDILRKALSKQTKADLVSRAEGQQN